MRGRRNAPWRPRNVRGRRIPPSVRGPAGSGLTATGERTGHGPVTCRGKEAVRTRTLQKCPTSPGGTGPLPLLVRLVPDQPIFLRALGWGDDDRFAGCFASAWRALPRVAREGIVRLWETHPSWGDL